MTDKQQETDNMNTSEKTKSNRNRPYNGQLNGITGERSAHIVTGLTERDILDCVTMGLLALGGCEELYDKVQKFKGNVNGEAEWTYNDLYDSRLDFNKMDPIALLQNIGCYLEMYQGIYPNISKLTHVDDWKLRRLYPMNKTEGTKLDEWFAFSEEQIKKQLEIRKRVEDALTVIVEENKVKLQKVLKCISNVTRNNTVYTEVELKNGFKLEERVSDSLVLSYGSDNGLRFAMDSVLSKIMDYEAYKSFGNDIFIEDRIQLDHAFAVARYNNADIILYMLDTDIDETLALNIPFEKLESIVTKLNTKFDKDLKIGTKIITGYRIK